MSALQSCGAGGLAAFRYAVRELIVQPDTAAQSRAIACCHAPQATRSFLREHPLIASASVFKRSFGASNNDPNPLGSTNISGATNSSGVGDTPLAGSSAPEGPSSRQNPLAAVTGVSSSSTAKPNPLEATTSVSSGSAAKPNPLEATTSVSPGSAAKPDPLAASTNVQADTSGRATSSYSFQQSTYDGPPKLIVFGGNGFVGTRVCEEALQTGLAVVSVSRSGPPKSAPSASWTSQVDWLSADGFEADQWRDQLQGAVGVVTCLGGFGSNDFMLKICGEANVGVIREAARAGVPRCAFISVHDYQFPSFVLSGYFQGKRNAEHAMAEAYPDQGVCLRPGFIHGTRYVSGGVGIPLSTIGSPLEKALGFLPARSLAKLPIGGAAFVPPTSVQAVAKAAVAAATDPAVPGGIMDVWQLQQYDKQ